MPNRWDKRGIPHKGWHCVDVIDLRPDGGPIDMNKYETCEICEHPRIRFIHVMEHNDHYGQLKVGCVCAEKMSEDYYSPKAREMQLKRKAARRRNWLSLKRWKTSKTGNLSLKKNGMTLYAFQGKSSRWRYGIKYKGTCPKLIKESCQKKEEAQLALFELYWIEKERDGL